MGVLKDLKERFDRERVELDLDDIQGLVLRSRPEPYVGAHAMLTVEEAEGGRDFVRRLAEHVTSAQDWACLLYTSPSPRDRTRSRMPSSA